MGIRDLWKAAGQKQANRTERDIQSVIAEGEKEGLIDPYSAQMIRSILEFRTTVVREIMVPRTEIVAVEDDASVEAILDIIGKHGYTRMPVFSQSMDHIIGVLNVKDLLALWSKAVSREDILACLRKPYYIPETKNVNILLHELKREKHHMAIVIDEYGGTSGLVTLEDLIEEIVGEISDEYDTEERNIVALADGALLVAGRTEIDEVARTLGVEFPEGKFETLGGLILHLMRKIPVAGENVLYGGLEMVIESADERNIRRVRIKKVDEKGRDAEFAIRKSRDE